MVALAAVYRFDGEIRHAVGLARSLGGTDRGEVWTTDCRNLCLRIFRPAPPEVLDPALLFVEACFQGLSTSFHKYSNVTTLT
jgi:hypothetical protein